MPWRSFGSDTLLLDGHAVAKPHIWASLFRRGRRKLCNRWRLNRSKILEILEVLANPILPIFAIMAFGFVLGRSGRTSVGDARVINRFALSVLLPIFLFNFSAQTAFEKFNPLPIFTYLGAEFCVFILGFLLATKVLKRSAEESILLAMSGVIANNAFYVLPIALHLYGPVGGQPFVAITALDALVGFSAIIIALGFVKQGKLSFTTLVSSVLRSPVIIALTLGFAFAATGLTMPPSLESFIAFNGAAAAPVALFALGVVLSQTPFRADPAVAAFTSIKLLLFPAAVWFGLKAVSYQADDVHIYMLSAAGPSVAMSFSLALLYDIPTETLAQIMIWTTLLSLISLAVLA